MDKFPEPPKEALKETPAAAPPAAGDYLMQAQAALKAQGDIWKVQADLLKAQTDALLRLLEEKRSLSWIQFATD